MFFYEPLVSCPGCVSVEAFKTNFTHFLVMVNSNPEVDSPMECHESVRVRQGGRMAVAAGAVSSCQFVSLTVVALTFVEWP